MMIGIVKREIQGKFHKYTELRSLQGYCFYDVDEAERNYLTSILTPITDEAELERKYVVVFGDVEKLNDELRQERSPEHEE